MLIANCNLHKTSTSLKFLLMFVEQSVMTHQFLLQWMLIKTYRLPVGGVPDPVLNLVHQTHPARLNIRWWRGGPARKDVKVKPWAADVQEGPVESNWWVRMHWRSCRKVLTLNGVSQIITESKYNTCNNSWITSKIAVCKPISQTLKEQPSHL